MMAGTKGEQVMAPIASTVRAKLEMMGVNVAAVGASRHLAFVPVTLKHIVVARCFMVRLLHKQVF